METSNKIHTSQSGNLSSTIAEENPFESLHIPLTSRVKQIWAVGGGKGGVGKSLISSSLAIALARAGNRVVTIDLDIGGANLHTTLGIDLPKQTLSDFLSGRVDSLQQCTTPTDIPNLEIISGAQDSVRVTNIRHTDKVRLLQEIPSLNADYLVFDLGAGTAHATIDFFLYADIGVVIMLPEPTSIENAYRFIKCAYYRRLWVCPQLEPVRNLIELAMDPRNNLGIRTPADLYREVNNASPEAGRHLKEEIDKFQPKLIVNQARTQTDIDIGYSVRSVCKKYFGIDMDYAGYLDYDSSVWQAVRRKRPFMIEFPNSPMVSHVERIVHSLLKKNNNQKSGIF